MFSLQLSVFCHGFIVWSSIAMHMIALELYPLPYFFMTRNFDLSMSSITVTRTFWHLRILHTSYHSMRFSFLALDVVTGLQFEIWNLFARYSQCMFLLNKYSFLSCLTCMPRKYLSKYSFFFLSDFALNPGLTYIGNIILGFEVRYYAYYICRHHGR